MNSAYLPVREIIVNNMRDPTQRRSVLMESVSILTVSNLRMTLLPAQARAQSRAMLAPGMLLSPFKKRNSERVNAYEKA